MDSFHRKPYRVTLWDQAIADRALVGMPAPYRRLDTAVLEALVLRGALGMSEDDISHLRAPLLEWPGRRDRGRGERPRRRRVLHAPHAGRAGARGRGHGRVDAAQVDLLLPEGPDRPRVQSPGVKIYTRKGDDGTTGLWYGGRVPKYAGRPRAR